MKTTTLGLYEAEFAAHLKKIEGLVRAIDCELCMSHRDADDILEDILPLAAELKTAVQAAMATLLTDVPVAEIEGT